MLTDKRFLTGVVVGIVGMWAFHAFVRPVPSQKSAG